MANARFLKAQIEADSKRFQELKADLERIELNNPDLLRSPGIFKSIWRLHEPRGALTSRPGFDSVSLRPSQKSR
jgi:hypothetical protein